MQTGQESCPGRQGAVAPMCMEIVGIVGLKQNC